MANIILVFIMVCLAILGVTEIIKAVSFYLTAPSDLVDQFSVIVPDDSDLEYTVRSFAERSRWNFYSNKTKIVILNTGLSKESIEICNRLVKEYDGLMFLSLEEFENAVRKDGKVIGK